MLLSLFVSAAIAQESPLLDRDLFFGNPEISGSQLSPDGKYVSFMKEFNGIMNVWVKEFAEPFDKARPVTNSPRPLYGYFWTRDGKYILYVKDNDGDENINIFSVNPSASVDKDGVPPSRNLTDKKGVRAEIMLVSKKDPDVLFVGLNDRDPAWHDLYRLSISTGKLDLLYKNEDRVTGYDFDWDEKLRVMSKTDEKGTTKMFRVDPGNRLSEIYSFNVNEQAYIAGWSEDNRKCYLVSNKGDLDKSSLFLMDPADGSLTFVEKDPGDQVDFGGIMFDDNTRKMINTSYTVDKTEYNWKDKKWLETYSFLESSFPGREVVIQSSTQDYSKLLVALTGDRYASEVHFLDVDSRQLVFQYTSRPALKKVEQYLAEMRPVTYPSSDGMMIPAYLTLPTGKKPEKLPVVILVHGGPKGPREYWGYDPEVQFLANRGYAVLQPNFRASGGYGKKFLNAGDLQWGKLMQDDITWGVKYLVEQGIADKDKVAIMGGSYGGYATLAGLAFTPELYACGVDIVGPSNIFTLLESVPAYWEAGRAFLYGMVGDPNTEEGKKRIREASPLFSAEKINKPLLIIQGANDPRVKQAEADQIVVALREKKKKVSYLLAADEGHGFAKPLNRKAMYAEVEKFLSEVLGGRYQAEMDDDIRKTLAKLRVDVSTVKYEPAKTETSAAALPAVKDVFSKMNQNYQVTLEIQGRKMDMTMTRSVEKKGDNWLVADEVSGAMGQMKDAILYSATGSPVTRDMEQMGQKISMAFEPGKAVVDMQGKKQEMKMSPTYWMDGPGCDHIMACWPLKEGFSIVTELPDMTTMQGKQVKIEVKGREKVNEADCWMVEMTNTSNSSDKTTFWINSKTKSAEKMVSVMPAMGNAVMTIRKG